MAFGVVDTSSVLVAANPLLLPFTNSGGSSPVAGNLLLVGVHQDDITEPSLAPGSWTRLSVAASTDFGLCYFWKVASGSETGNLTITTTAGVAAVMLEVALPAGFTVDSDGNGDIDQDVGGLASPASLVLDDGGTLDVGAADGAVQVQAWFAVGNDIAFAGNVGGSVSADSLTVAYNPGVTPIRWRMDVLDLSGTLGDTGVTETITATTSSGDVVAHDVERMYVIDDNFVATPARQQAVSRTLPRHVSVSELPYIITDNKLNRGRI